VWYVTHRKSGPNRFAGKDLVLWEGGTLASTGIAGGREDLIGVMEADELVEAAVRQLNGLVGLERTFSLIVVRIRGLECVLRSGQCTRVPRTSPLRHPTEPLNFPRQENTAVIAGELKFTASYPVGESHRVVRA